MDDSSRSRIIEDNPIGNSFDAFRAFFTSVCEGRGISPSIDALNQLGREDLKELVPKFLRMIAFLPAADLLPSRGRNTLSMEILVLKQSSLEDDFDFDRVKPLIELTIANDSNDTLFWDQVNRATIESTPPPRPAPSAHLQTPSRRGTGNLPNSSEFRTDFDKILKEELDGIMYVGLHDFHRAYFGDVADLETGSKAFFEQCIKGDNSLLFDDNGWSGWPEAAKEVDVLSWFTGFYEKLASFAEGYKSIPIHHRRLLAQPHRLISGSSASRKIDIGFVNDPEPRKGLGYQWHQILVPGELKSNPSEDTFSSAWLDLGRYAREVFATQFNRRFVLGFTVCGSFMRTWQFDRLGAIASDRFDINRDGLRFVTIMLGFLWMSKDQLGFDPTVIDNRYIDIQRNGQTERLIIDQCMTRAHCIVGRATTCWKTHRQGDHTQTTLVVKDSWQYVERDEEGEMLRDATNQGVKNVARYFHHETIQVAGIDDDIQSNTRKGLDLTTAENYQGQQSALSERTTTVGSKRSSIHLGPSLPPSKRFCSNSSTQAARPTTTQTLGNRVHRRVVLCDFGKPIYKATSRVALVCALEGCITGHESLHQAGFLHRDISINNLMINEDADNPSWFSFLIDLDLAIKELRDGASGAQARTGTRAFMAIRALEGDQHSFMHDLESFFWVFFWICIHYNGPTSNGRVLPLFDSWHYMSLDQLINIKIGIAINEPNFLKTIDRNCTNYYRPLIPLLKKLRKIMFLDGVWERENEALYSQMRKVLQEYKEVEATEE